MPSAPDTTEYQPSLAVLHSSRDHLGSEGGDFWTCGDMCNGVSDAEHAALRFILEAASKVQSTRDE